MAGNQFFLGVIALLVLHVLEAYSQTNTTCTPSNCQLPACRCSGSDIPGSLNATKTPQLVFLSFDAAVNEDNFAFYRDALFSRKNPNNQPITATFFVSHDYTIYSYIHELWRKGHEISLHSISGNSSQAYWQSLDAAMWRKELIDQREQITTFARIRATDIKGVRAPQLQTGGDVMYEVLQRASLQWDASRPTIAFQESGLWPYTNDFDSIQDCLIQPCPVKPHPGFWTVPLVSYKSKSGAYCSLADQCTPVPETSDDTYNLLYNNFMNHYNGSRSPFGVFTRHGWVNGTGDANRDEIWQRRLGYFRFLDYLGTLDDVYIVSISRGLEWVKNPTPVPDVETFPHFQVTERPTLCPKTFSCYYTAGQTPFKPPLSQERYFHSCVQCPNAYPWVGNHLGRDGYNNKN